MFIYRFIRFAGFILLTATAEAFSRSGKIIAIFLFAPFLFFPTACLHQPVHFTMNIVHTNDTHSHLEQAAVNITVNGIKTTARLGGFARLKTALDEMRIADPDLLFLHGGDAVQGTVYFSLFNGEVEFDFLNLLGVDAMTFGNHEFDRGVKPIPGWIARSNFPWLSANIDFSQEPAIAPLVKPYVIKTVRGNRVGIIGVTTETTSLFTLDTGKTVFRDAAASVRTQVAELSAAGVNKIVLLSHLGYHQDIALASQVSGIDVIVGGHSHSLLGDKQALGVIGLTTEGAYPTEVLAPDGKIVLVLQAWQWGHVLGKLQVHFSSDGEVTGYDHELTIPFSDYFVRNNVPVAADSEQYREIRKALQATGAARIIAEDPIVKDKLRPYAEKVNALRSTIIAIAADDIIRGPDSGPGSLIADALLDAVPRASVAVINNGAVRKDLAAGNISASDALEVLPFNNSLIIVELTGAELKAALEDGIDYLLKKYPGKNPPAIPYVAGITFVVHKFAPKGDRVKSLAVSNSKGDYQPVNPAEFYRTITNAFTAQGGDGFTAIKNARGFREDTGITDTAVFYNYLKKMGKISNPARQRITIRPD